MEVPNDLTEVLAEEREARLIEESIYSVLSQFSLKHHYDRRSAVYDALVSIRPLLRTFCAKPHRTVEPSL